MLRLALLRVPRPRPALPPSRACRAAVSPVFASWSRCAVRRRYASTTPANEAKRGDPALPSVTDPSTTHATTASTQHSEIFKEEAPPPTIHIHPSDGSKEHASSTPERASVDTARSSSDAPSPHVVAKPSGLDVEKLKEKLREWSENAAIATRERVDRYTASAIKTFAQLGRELNKVTGYGEIEGLKRQVAEQEASIKAARSAARHAKQELERATQQRQKSQREVNDLLSRKSSWNDDDVVRFTALVRQDHLYEQAESHAKEQAIHTEDEVDRAFTELMRVILNRYHEEQIWSDKIRSASTYGSLTVIGLNMLVFILAIIVVEPWKRRRLAQTFENKVEEMSEATITAFEQKTNTLSTQLQEQEKTLAQLVEVVTYSMQPAQLLPPQPVPEPPAQVLPEVPEETPLFDVSVTGEKVSTILRQLHLASRREQELAIAATAGATAAGIVGWIVRSWFGS